MRRYSRGGYRGACCRIESRFSVTASFSIERRLWDCCDWCLVRSASYREFVECVSAGTEN